MFMYGASTSSVGEEIFLRSSKTDLDSIIMAIKPYFNSINVGAFVCVYVHQVLLFVQLALHRIYRDDGQTEVLKNARLTTKKTHIATERPNNFQQEFEWESEV